jgi:hypothetical protein
VAGRIVDGVGPARWRAGPALPGRGRPQPAAEHDDHGRARVPGQSDPCLWQQGAPPIAGQPTRSSRESHQAPGHNPGQVRSPAWNCAPGGALLAIWPGSMTPTRGYPLPRTEVPPPPRHRGSSRPAEPHSTSTRHPALAGHRDLHLDTAIRLVTRLLRELTRKVP